MKRTMGGLVILAAATAFGAAELSAQRGPGARQGFADRDRGAGVEMIMRMRAELELSDRQIQDLEAIRQEVVQLRTADQAEMAELRSRLRAGEIERSAVRDAMEARAEARHEAANQRRERVDAILDDTQRETLQAMGDRADAFARGFAMGSRGNRPDIGGRPGFGPRVGRPGLQGRRGGGFAPGRGQGMMQRRGRGFGPAGNLRRGAF